MTSVISAVFSEKIASAGDRIERAFGSLRALILNRGVVGNNWKRFFHSQTHVPGSWKFYPFEAIEFAHNHDEKLKTNYDL